MKRIIGLVSLIVLGLVAFYGAWPAWTGHQIRKAIETNDPALLESKVDFPAVRQSLRPVVAAEIERGVERAARDAGPLGALIASQIKGDVANRLVEGTINSTLTPPNVIRMIREGRDMRQSIEKVLLEQLGRQPGQEAGASAGGRLPGGLGDILGQRRSGGASPERQAESKGPQPGQTPPPAQAPAPRKMTLSNIKRYAIDGPLAFTIGVARDPAATEPDLTAQLRFVGGDWKVVSLIPRTPAR